LIVIAATRSDVAHDAFVDRRRIDARAPDGFAHDDRAQLRRAELLQGSEELADRRTNGRHNDCVAHMTRLSGYDVDSIDRIPDQLPNARQNRLSRAVDFLRPSAVARRGDERPAAKLDRRDAGERRTDGHRPGEGGSFLGRGLAADDLREDGRGELMQGHHERPIVAHQSDTRERT
jgi:hypothetical protein